MSEQISEKIVSRKPKDDAFRQQRMLSWQPIMTPLKVVIIFFAVAVAFIPTGDYLIKQSNAIYEDTYEYSANSDCDVSKTCTYTFTISEDISGPLYVYYKLDNFYQNHRRYVASRSTAQLMGANLNYNDVSSNCDPIVKVDSMLLNPCGLIAASYFTDEIQLSPSTNAVMDETGIIWPSDKEKYIQVEGFDYIQCTNAACKLVCPVASTDYSDVSAADCDNYGLSKGCKCWGDGTNSYLFYYPNDDTVQYLYETYPYTTTNTITPISGVESEHFIVWMRTASLPTFRKLYGIIDSDFSKGDKIKFTIKSNFEVDSFDGTKSLVISTISAYGGKNSYLGVAYIVVGSFSLFLGALFGIRSYFNVRQFGDPDILHWD